MYFQYATLPENGWNKDSTLGFDFQIDDTAVSYNVTLNSRNTSDYPYQNLWLFLKQSQPDSIIKNDTINYYLADDYGKWLGSGIGSLYQMPVLWQQNMKFPKSGKYHIAIGHGMRDSILIGITEIGLKIEKVKP
ncbi:MAG: hypothetical protein AUK44_08545 [Porphyromonadaceae bacterium CG2_30_38_12]|nr:MAG: hypothetical protein AUK44_08545 [Porphyromonadaceae bacterium CG2_30_38_12]